MKGVVIIILLLASFSLSGQYNRTKEWQSWILGNLSNIEYKDSLNHYDFGKLWTETENTLVFGFIGENYQRIRIKIISTSRKDNNSSIYEIIGKSMVKNNICTFHGTITISSIKIYKQMHWGVDDEYKNKKIQKQGVLIANYYLKEDSIQIHSGVFEGILYTSWYIDSSGKLKYDNIEINSDSYTNNQFIGKWIDYKTHKSKKCNWGDYRIPYCGDLDGGAAEFYINEKYLKNGWENYYKAYEWGGNQEARQEEEKQWWK
jgi:hypothetical protein